MVIYAFEGSSIVLEDLVVFLKLPHAVGSFISAYILTIMSSEILSIDVLCCESVSKITLISILLATI